MPNVLIGFKNRADTATLSGGMYSIDRNNLKDGIIKKIARTNTCEKRYTRFAGSWATNYLLRALGIRYHNLSRYARWRVRAGRAALDLMFDSEDGDIMDSRLTKSGGTNGTRTNKRGVLVRTTVTNLLLYTTDITHAAWLKTNTTATSTTVAPDNATSMFQLTESAAVGFHNVYQYGTVSAAGQPVTFAVNLRAGTCKYAYIQMLNNVEANTYVRLNIETGEVLSVGSGVTNYVVEPWGAGRFRCAVTGTTTGTSVQCLVVMTDAVGTTSYMGSTSNYMYLSDPQLEENGDMSPFRVTMGTTDTQTVSGRINYSGFRTNILKGANSFETSYWNKASLTRILPGVQGPDGNYDAVKLCEGTDTAGHYVVQSPTYIAGTTYTASVYAKSAGDSRFVQLIVTNTAFGSTLIASFNPDTGDVSTNGVAMTAKATPVGDGWWRFEATATATTTAAANFQIRLSTSQTAYGPSYAGNGLKGVYICRAQMEAAPAATAYIDTLHLPNTVVDECEGVLIEAAKTNMLLHSSAFDNAAWLTWFSSISANSGIAPDRAKTADKLVEDNTLNSHTRETSATIIAGRPYTFSIYAKTDSRKHLWMFFKAGAFAATDKGALFNLSTGTVSNVTVDATTVEAAGDGWWRISITVNASAAPGAGNLFVGLSDGTSLSYTGDGVSGVYIWGAQLEESLYASSYIPTTTAAVTRAGDNVVVEPANFSASFNPLEGTFYAQVVAGPVESGGFPRFLDVHDLTSSNSYRLQRYSTGTIRSSVVTGGVAQAGVDSGTAAVGETTSAAFSYKVNDYILVGKGGVPSTDYALTLPNVLQLNLGTDWAATSVNTLNGCVKRITYWPERLKNSELLTITSDSPDAIGFNSGWQDCLQFAFEGDTPNDWGKQYDLMMVFDDEVDTSNFIVELDDLRNPASYIDMGRLYAMGALRPVDGAVFGARQDSREELSLTQKSRMGRQFSVQHARQRAVDFGLPQLSQDGADWLHEMFDAVGTMEEILIVPNPDNMADSQRYGFLGLLSELGPLDYPSYNTRSTKFRAKEKL